MNGDPPEKDSGKGGGGEEESNQVIGESGTIYENKQVPDDSLGTRDQLVSEGPAPIPFGE